MRINSSVSVRASINIALVKYWGKRDAAANLPDVGSISLTLDGPGTETRVRFGDFARDSFTLDGEPADGARVFAALDAVRAAAGIEQRAEVLSHNSVPTAAGLASSASGASALGLAAWRAAGLDAEDPRLVDLVRRISGSGPRSLLGGLVELDRDSGRVRQLLAEGAWDLRLVMGLAAAGPKKTSSREGMARSKATSPYYPAWVASHEADMEVARRAIAARDLAALGEVMEHSTMKMHACMLATRPAVRYWRPESVAMQEAVADLRPRAWFTMDAGPHVKVLCEAADAAKVQAALAGVVGADRVLLARPGSGATVLQEGA